MSSDELAIEVNNVCKCYHLYDRAPHRLKQFVVPRSVDLLHRMRLGKIAGLPRPESIRYFHEFWALHSVSMHVQKGEAVGIVGRNGSGKSTLLQIIAGTVTPTFGSVRVAGRLSALLELGAGFNPEFTGRDNVFLSAAILGLTTEEVEQRFDDICAFADIGEYLLQPVKTYSSGMFARLAFSVAICVDPDVLIVDEILSVGDIAFQQKCVARMRQMRDNGLTLLFVSHSTDAIRSVCSKALLLVKGKALRFGLAEPVVDDYLNLVREEINATTTAGSEVFRQPVPVAEFLPGHNRYGTGHVQFHSIVLRDDSGIVCQAFRFGDWVNVEIGITAYRDVDHVNISFLVRDTAGIDLTGTMSFDEQLVFPPLSAGASYVATIRFQCVFRAGSYGLSIAVNRVTRRDGSDVVLFDQIDGCGAFTVTPDANRPVHYKFHLPSEFKLRPATKNTVAEAQTKSDEHSPLLGVR